MPATDRPYPKPGDMWRRNDRKKYHYITIGKVDEHFVYAKYHNQHEVTV